MATVARDFTYFDRSFAQGDEVDDTDPVVTLMPQMFEKKSKVKKQPGGQPPKPKEA